MVKLGVSQTFLITFFKSLVQRYWSTLLRGRQRLDGRIIEGDFWELAVGAAVAVAAWAGNFSNGWGAGCVFGCGRPGPVPAVQDVFLDGAPDPVHRQSAPTSLCAAETQRKLR